MYSEAVLSLAYGLGTLTFVIAAGAILEILINKVKKIMRNRKSDE